MSAQDASLLIAGSNLVYVSDYVSFVGADEQGHVAFAIDTNRGRDGTAYQAEHLYSVLHDEEQGWGSVAGVGRYENRHRDLLRIPDSPGFQFAGQPATGLTLTSAVNHLTLQINPITERVQRSNRKVFFSLGSAAARLRWKERLIPGRVIYESLVMQDFNLMTRRSLKGLAAFQGLYLLVGTGADLYLQRVGTAADHARQQQREGAFALIGGLLGFAVFDEQPEELDRIRFEISRHALAWGIYRWPTTWRVSWQGIKGPASLALTLTTRKPLGNWALAGFSMGIVVGELSYNGQQMPVYGLAELLMM
jgi:hypothetical protein